MQLIFDLIRAQLREMIRSKAKGPEYNMKTTADFKPGQSVRYIPTHALGDASHKDCENGIVTSVNDKVVFVRYSFEGCTSQATDPNDLI